MIHSPMLSRVLVGRDEELDALERLVQGALDGHGATALIGGDAGTGKTRLCRELRARAAVLGARVIEGRCSTAESGVPYGPFLDALRFRIARGEGREVAATLAPILAHVAPLFEELAAGSTGRPRPTAVAMPFDRILGVLRRFAAGGPVLLLLEDIHWADPTSRDLLHHLARRIAGEPILLVATYRTDELNPGHPVHRLVAALGRERLAHRI
jgi:predicted ATPase